MWEYKFVGMRDDIENNDFTSVEEFNEYGDDGWELVAIYQMGGVRAFDLDSAVIKQLPVYVTENSVAIFKRKRRN